MLTWWNSLQPQVQGAFISGLFTLLTALGGAGLVIWQLRRQATNAIAASKFNEAVKLKKEVYDNMMAATTSARGTISAGQQALHSALIEMRVWMHFGDKARTDRPPAMDRTTLADRLSKAHSSFDEVMRLLGAWTVIDPRVSIFSIMGDYVLSDYSSKWLDYTNLAVVLLPGTDAPRPRAIATQEDAEVLVDRSQKLEDVFARLIYILEDAERELQGILLSDLFSHPLPASTRNRPSDLPVIELKNFAELERKYGQRPR